MSYRSELVALTDRTLDWLRRDEVRANRFNIETVAYCLMTSISQLVKGALGTITESDLLSYQIMRRSLVEYLLDLMFLSKQQGDLYTRRLRSLHDVTIWLKRDMIDSPDYREYLPKARDRFLDAIAKEYKEFLTKKLEGDDKRKGRKIADLKDVEAAMRDVVNKGWTLLDVRSRLQVVCVLYTVGAPDNASALSQWSAAESRVSKGHKNWRELPWMAKADIIIKHLQSEANLAESGKEALDEAVGVILKAFRFGSEYTHPTSRSIFPHFNPSDHSFHLNHKHPAARLRQVEETLFLLFRSAVKSVSPLFSRPGEESLHRQFDGWAARSETIRKRLFDRKE